MLNVALIFCQNLFLCVLIFAANLLIYKAYYEEKARPFECGFDPNQTRLHFCIKFFLICILFLIFDVEVTLILPLPHGPLYVTAFLFILLWGLIYE